MALSGGSSQLPTGDKLLSGPLLMATPPQRSFDNSACKVPSSRHAMKLTRAGTDSNWILDEDGSLQQNFLQRFNYKETVVCNKFYLQCFNYKEYA